MLRVFMNVFLFINVIVTSAGAVFTCTMVCFERMESLRPGVMEF